MLTAKDVQGVMAMMPSFSTKDAGDLTSKNTIDVDNLKAGVDRMINDGIDVITTTGSFGECYNLDWDEYKTLAVAAVDAVRTRVPLFIGATSPNAREVVERLKFVQDIGGDGTLLGVPYYDAQSPEYMADFYTQIAEMFPKLGLLIYHNPVNHKVRIPVSVFPRLVKCPNIIGMKDSSNEIAKFRETVNMVRKDFAMMIGNGTVFSEALQLGARGGILAVGCVVPELCLEIYRAVQASDLDRASALQEKLTPLARAVTKTYGIGGLKSAMEMAFTRTARLEGRNRLPWQSRHSVGDM